MHKTIILSALGAFLCVTGAQAQTAPIVQAPVSKAITIKLGAFFPSSGDVKNAAGSTFFSVGAEYAFISKNSASPIVPLVYVDYAGGSKKTSVDDGAGNSASLDLSASTVGIGGGARYEIGASGTSMVVPYVGAGVGVYFDHVKAAVNLNAGGQSDSGSDSLNKTQLGFRLNAGVEFQKMYLLEVNYTNAGSVEGTRIDGFGVQAGVRF
jgi:opacity protein-like surface antigen